MPIRNTYWQIIAIVVVVQLVLIGFLSVRIYGNWHIRTSLKDRAITFAQDTVSRPEADLPGFYEPKPNSVNEMEPTWLGKKVVQHINNEGLRDTHSYAHVPDDDVFRIAVLGDSFTYGLFVGDTDTYTEKLATLLNAANTCPAVKKFEVMNFGVPGYDLEMSAYRYNFRVKNYKPNLVLWYLIENDFSEYASLVQDLWLHTKEMLVASNVSYEKFGPETAEIYENVVISRLGKTFVPDHQENVLHDWVQGIDVPFVIFSDTTLPKADQDRIRNEVVGHSLGSYFDSVAYTNAFAEGHPSPESHTDIARQLFVYLTDHHLLACGDK